MPPIIDRRLNPGGKNFVNRQKFLRRAKENIKKTVKDSVAGKSLKDIGKGENVKIKSHDLHEPGFRKDPKTGDFEGVLNGNEEYTEGDLIPKPPSGRGAAGRKAGKGSSDDDFYFTLSRDEFIDYLFEDLALPDFVKQSLQTETTFKYTREGFTASGSPPNLNVEQTFKNSIGRRIALQRPSDQEVEEAEEAYRFSHGLQEDSRKVTLLYDEWQRLVARQKIVPFIDETDLKYNHWAKKPERISKAVMFCIMDVSGSMGPKEKDISKRFFLLLYLFLERNYENVEIRFIRHTEVADEVDEHTFFYDTFSGGTAISSALELVKEIANEEYNTDEINIYIAQCTDGDNFSHDNQRCAKILKDDLLPITQYFAYIQVQPYERGTIFDSWTAWPTYSELSDQYQKLVCCQITDQREVWQVFRNLFEKSDPKKLAA